MVAVVVVVVVIRSVTERAARFERAARLSRSTSSKVVSSK